MHTVIGKFIQHQIKAAHEFIINRIEVRMTADEVYEQLIGEPHVLAAFRNATQYLPSQSFNASATIHYGDSANSYNRLRVVLRFPATERYQQRFIPNYPLRVTPQSDLGRFLAKQLMVTAQWTQLQYVFDQFFLADVGALEIAFLMRWVRELISDCEWKDEPAAFINRWGGEWRKDFKRVDREMQLINSHKTPDHFPIVTRRVSDICKSGKGLFGQYRILQSVDEPREPPLITLSNSNARIDEALEEEMKDIITQWQSEKVPRR